MTFKPDVRSRASDLARAARETYDLIIIGGGITGAGILRDASLRGLRVLLVEAQDFASGTSSKSTKLIHGGIRYLQTGHFHVVREAAIERKRVHTLAPHLATPDWLVLPAGNALEHAKYRVGVNLYEQLGQVQGPDRHFNLRGDALREFEPLLDTNRFPYATVYREYLTDDARLVMANIRAGIAAGGIAFNYLGVDGVIWERGQVAGVSATCQLSGDQLALRAKVVINAAGPWVESVCQAAGVSNNKSLVLSKGVHIMIPRQRLALKHPQLLVHEDGRPVFTIPRGQVVYVGTTDTRYDHSDHWPEVTADEISYLYAPIARYFGLSLQPADCLGSWAGLRPLIAEQGKSTTEISRKDEVWLSAPGFITVAGGKLTGYRKMAEDTVNTAVAEAGLSALPAAGDDPLPGGDFSGTPGSLVASLRTRTNCGEACLSRLVGLYGTEAMAVLAAGDEPLAGSRNLLRGEIVWAVADEGAVHLEDLVYRRSRIALYDPAELAVLDAAADVMAELLDWDPAERARELEAVRARLAADLSALPQLTGTSANSQLTAASS